MSRYVEYFSPRFLFLTGDTNLRHHIGHGGELFLFLIPLILAGLYVVLRSLKTDPTSRFIVLGLLVYPTAAALTEDRMHSMRCLNGVTFWLLVAAIGAQCLWQHRRSGRVLLLASCCAGVVETGLYMKDYFGPYQIRSRPAFSAPFIEALETCFRTVGSNETVHISDSTFALWRMHVTPDFKPVVYADILFFGKIDPRVYQQQGNPKDRVRLYDGTISQPGVLLRSNLRWIEMPKDWIPPGATAPFQRKGDRIVWPYLFDTNNEPIPPGAQLLETKPAGGAFQFEIYRVN